MPYFILLCKRGSRRIIAHQMIVGTKKGIPFFAVKYATIQKRWSFADPSFLASYSHASRAPRFNSRSSGLRLASSKLLLGNRHIVQH
jgi:hypothetical protein